MVNSISLKPSLESSLFKIQTQKKRVVTQSSQNIKAVHYTAFSLKIEAKEEFHEISETSEFLPPKIGPGILT